MVSPARVSGRSLVNATARKQQSINAFLQPMDGKGKGRAKRRISDESIQIIEAPTGVEEKRRRLEVKDESPDEEADLVPVDIPQRGNGPECAAIDRNDIRVIEVDGEEKEEAVKTYKATEGTDRSDHDDYDIDDDYPPPNHPSYHLPPSPSFNHPITIAAIPPPLRHLRFNTTPRSILKPQYGLDLLYFKRFIDPSSSRQLTKYLLEAMPWYRVKYSVRGIQINTPRFTTVFGKDSTGTPWNGYDRASPRAIPPILLKLMRKVEQVTGETYNFTLVNYYASGSDSISYHSDSESFLGRNPCIASISLGASRDFLMRHIDYKNNGQSDKFALQDGDMVVMRGRTQHDWQHSIPKRKSAEGRINITFRKGVVKYATQNYNDYNVGKGPMYRWEKGQMVEKK